MDFVQLANGKLTEEQVNSRIHPHFRENGDTLFPGFPVQLHQLSGITAAYKGYPRIECGPRDGIAGSRWQHASHHLGLGFLDRPLSFLLAGSVQGKEAHLS